MSIIRESFRQGVRSLRSSIMRTTLTMLGMIIGVSSIIILLTLGGSAQAVILSEIEDLGTNLVYVIAGGDNANMAASASFRTIKNSDIDALRRANIGELSPFTRTARLALKEGENDEVFVNIWGVDRPYFFMQNITFEEGRAWTEEEEKSEKKVVVLGGKIDDNIFGEGHGSLIGKKLKLKGQTYSVVGVIKEQEGVLSSFGNENNEYIFTPTPVAQKNLVDTSDFVWGIAIKAPSESEVEPLKKSIESILRREHKLTNDDKNDFRFMSQDQFIAIFSSIVSIFTVFLSFLAAISLIVGGIGIMNIMLVIVTERITEIGVRKALGATRKHILVQFLIEAMILTGLGGGSGVLLGLFVAFLVTKVAGIVFIFSLETVLFAFIGSALFGVVFGLWPALKASKLDPILAIRHR